MNRGRAKSALTLLEVMLAVALTAGLMGSMLWFYHHAVSGRSSVLREVEIATAQRVIMDRITDELRGAIASRFLSLGVEGRTDEIAFLTVRLPGLAVWAEVGRAEDPPPPETDVQLVGYRLRIQQDESGAVLIDGLERTFQKTPTARQAEEGEGVDASLLSEHIKFVGFRYWDGNAWADSWSGGDMPLAVEISLGTEPLPANTDPAEYPFETVRRTVYIPAGEKPLTGGAVIRRSGGGGGR